MKLALDLSFPIPEQFQAEWKRSLELMAEAMFLEASLDVRDRLQAEAQRTGEAPNDAA